MNTITSVKDSDSIVGEVGHGEILAKLVQDRLSVFPPGSEERIRIS